MRSAPIELLALDVDGTICDSRHEVTPVAAAAIRRAIDAGIRVVLATGRRYRDAVRVAERVGVSGPVVTASGALVKDSRDHSTLFRAAFPAGAVAAMLRAIDARGHEPVVYTDSFAEGYDFHCRGPSCGGPGLREYLATNREVARVVPDLLESTPEGVFAAFTMGRRDEMLAMERALEAAVPGGLSLHVIRSPRYRDWMCEIAPVGVTKWSGIKRLATQWGIADAGICAVGDDVNDVPMLEGAGLGVAMGNATAEAIAAADRVAPTNDEDGIAAVVDWILG